MKPVKLNEADLRRIFHEPDPAALARIQALRAPLLEIELELAKLFYRVLFYRVLFYRVRFYRVRFYRIYVQAAYAGAGCSSIEDLASRVWPSATASTRSARATS